VAIISNAVTIADAGAFSVGLGSQVLIKTLTASSSATLSFLNGSDSVVFDGTYPIYRFEFINIHPASASNFTFQVDTGTNTSFNIAVTSTVFEAKHTENDGETQFRYKADDDQAQGTAFQKIALGVGAAADSNCCGELTIFNPSSTTFVKNFIGSTNNVKDDDQSNNLSTAGYFNTTTALTRVRFKMASGNIDSGKIKLYGIKDS